MANTQWKSVKLPRDHSGQAALAVSYPKIFYREPWRKSLASQDSVFNGARILLAQDTGGSNEWQVGNLASSGGAQVYPDPDLWRVIHVGRSRLAPGQQLEMRALCLPSGGTETLIMATGLWEVYGPAGSIRVGIGYENVDADTDSVEVVRHVPGSNNDLGYEDTDAGSAWQNLIHVYAGAVRPQAAITPSQIAKWSEYPSLDLTLSYRGGIRCFAINVSEIAGDHSISHDDLDSSAHDFPDGLGLPHQFPQTKDLDGATYDEPRFGTDRGLRVAARQEARYGPKIMSWGSHCERLAEVTDADPDPLSVTTTTWQSPFNSAQEGWDSNAPGWDMPGMYARVTPTNLDTRLRGNAAVIPVRVTAWARFTTDAATETGSIKFASSARSEITLSIPEESTWTEYTATGYLEANVTALDHAAILQPLVKVTGGTMEIRYLDVEYGAFAVA